MSNWHIFDNFLQRPSHKSKNGRSSHMILHSDSKSEMIPSDIHTFKKDELDYNSYLAILTISTIWGKKS